MAATNETQAKKVKEYLTKFPNSSKWAIARKLFKEHPLLFNNMECARNSIRYYTGTRGDLINKLKDKTFLSNPHNPFDLPDSDEQEWLPYILPKAANNILLISDLHIPYHNIKAITEALKYGKNAKVNTIFINGDLIDCYQASSFEKDPSKRRLSEEFEMTRQFLRSLKKHFPKCKIYFKEGNHCFDDQTEILTSRGWKKHNEISLNDSFATLNIGNDIIEYQKAEKIHNYEYNGDMVGIDSRGFNALVTDEHRMYFKYGSGNSEGFFRFDTAKNLAKTNNRVCFRVSGKMGLPDNGEITDDEIRICAWLHTDGSVNNKKENHHPQYLFYQRQSKVGLITEILDRLKYSYSYNVRYRRVQSICGRKLIKENENSCTLRIKRGINKHHRLDELIKHKYTLPRWVYNLSDRQFDIFLGSLIDGDGSRHKSSPNTSWMLYGIKSFIDQVQIACITHGYRTTISEYRPNTWKLNIFKGEYISVDKMCDKKSIGKYSGTVFCVTVPNSTVIVRRKGKVHVSGNCERYERLLRLKAPEILDMEEFKLDVILKLGEIGVEYIRDKRITKAGKLNILHGHEFQKGMIAPVNVARGIFLKAKVSTIVGHSHQTSEHTEPNLNGEIITTWSTGCLCELAPEYARINKFNHGFAHIMVNSDGSFNVKNIRIIKGKIV